MVAQLVSHHRRHRPAPLSISARHHPRRLSAFHERDRDLRARSTLRRSHRPLPVPPDPQAQSWPCDRRRTPPNGPRLPDPARPDARPPARPRRRRRARRINGGRHGQRTRIADGRRGLGTDAGLRRSDRGCDVERPRIANGWRDFGAEARLRRSDGGCRLAARPSSLRRSRLRRRLRRAPPGRTVLPPPARSKSWTACATSVPAFPVRRGGDGSTSSSPRILHPRRRLGACALLGRSEGGRNLQVRRTANRRLGLVGGLSSATSAAATSRSVGPPTAISASSAGAELRGPERRRHLQRAAESSIARRRGPGAAPRSAEARAAATSSAVRPSSAGPSRTGRGDAATAEASRLAPPARRPASTKAALPRRNQPRRRRHQRRRQRRPPPPRGRPTRHRTAPRRRRAARAPAPGRPRADPPRSRARGADPGVPPASASGGCHRNSHGEHAAEVTKAIGRQRRPHDRQVSAKMAGKRRASSAGRRRPTASVDEGAKSTSATPIPACSSTRPTRRAVAAQSAFPQHHPPRVQVRTRAARGPVQRGAKAGGRNTRGRSMHASPTVHRGVAWTDICLRRGATPSPHDRVLVRSTGPGAWNSGPIFNSEFGTCFLYGIEKFMPRARRSMRSANTISADFWWSESPAGRLMSGSIGVRPGEVAHDRSGGGLGARFRRVAEAVPGGPRPQGAAALGSHVHAGSAGPWGAQERAAHGGPDRAVRYATSCTISSAARPGRPPRSRRCWRARRTASWAGRRRC